MYHVAYQIVGSFRAQTFQAKIDHLEHQVRRGEEQQQQREEEYLSDMSDTKEILQELKHAVKVGHFVNWKNEKLTSICNPARNEMVTLLWDFPKLQLCFLSL